MVDGIINNIFFKIIVSFVNFCYEQSILGNKKLKFSKNMPLYKVNKSLNNTLVFKSIETHRNMN